MVRKIKNFFHLLEALAANIYYGFPSRKIFVIGVTGTDGKTTTTSLIYHILNKSGKKAAMITSVGAAIGNKTYDIGFHVTTPSSWGLQKYIKRAIDCGAEFLVLETTSHSLDQNRVYGVKYKIGVVTNVTHEHLDYHETYENYVRTKIKLLEMSDIAIVNRDDESYEIIRSKINPSTSLRARTQNSRLQSPEAIATGGQAKPKLKTSAFSKASADKQKFITYGMESNADVNPKSFPFKTNLIGEFNKYNTLAAIAVCKNLGLSDKQILSALLSFTPPPGREEIIYDKDFTVMIDFAHTPNAFLKILPEVRKIAKNRLIHVFGSAGRRDASKRPLMGEASAKYSDIIILTAEDPRSEPVERIMDEIVAGIFNFQFSIFNKNFKFQKNKKYLFRVPDRKKAIEFAIEIAQKGDLVICTGKSHEKSMNLGKGEEPWDEFRVAHEAIKKKEKYE